MSSGMPISGTFRAPACALVAVSVQAQDFLDLGVMPGWCGSGEHHARNRTDRLTPETETGEVMQSDESRGGMRRWGRFFVATYCIRTPKLMPGGWLFC
ncbi:hypothetical protein LX36DRAFT_466219 [Colletotrichum falcatum]|nr:hypothetical protein LX36DRAFT_466219 [Colletotrichum falcatum]